MKKKKLLLISIFLILLIFVVAFSGNLQERDKGKNYNVMFITVDALRPDHTNVYNYSKNTTPNLNKFSESSIVFDDAISPSGTTFLSFPSIFTSLYPVTDRITSNVSGLNWNANLSLVRLFKEEGYYTKAIVSHSFLKKDLGFSRYFESYDENFSQGFHDINLSKIPVDPSYETIKEHYSRRTANETTNIACNFLEGKRNKFFLWLHYIDPHSPYMPPEKEYISIFKSEFKGNNPYKETRIYGRSLNVSKSEIHKLNYRYDAELKYLDKYLGELLDCLEQENLKEDTIVVITADHGECLGEHDIFDHNNLHNCTLKVPLIVKIPGKQSKRINKPVSTLDILPTLLDYLKIETPNYLRGKNLFSDEIRSFRFAEDFNSYRIFSEHENIVKRPKTRKKLSENTLNDTKTHVDKEIRETLKQLGYLK